ncbi:MAG: 2-amino-4-hydroxy-6-hydroxymethyldihydropteridine diphosphokinase [Alphaproteobacteria bacterium]
MAHQFAVLSLGANIPRSHLGHGRLFRRVCRQLSQYGAPVVTASRLYRTAPWPPGAHAPCYSNAIVIVRAKLSAPSLLRLMLYLELTSGRRRSIPNAPRILDLDLLDYRGLNISKPSGTDCLWLPHPRMHQRAFVLAPLCDVWPTWRHPKLDVTAHQLLKNCDMSGVQILTSHAITGHKTRLFGADVEV